MILLASYPRSGNTFLRNILFDVFGMESSTFHKDVGRALDDNWQDFPVIKTHLLPEEIDFLNEVDKVIYLVRDGRDALVSMAHHRKDIVDPYSDYYINLLEATLASGGSFFGGWSQNVELWNKRADMVIRFEDLIADPQSIVKSLADEINIENFDISRIPSFQDLKFGQPQYGGGSGDTFNPDTLASHFRRGKVGSWKDEMPKDILDLFDAVHGQMLRKLEYVAPNQVVTRVNKKIMIEVSKVFSPSNDGVKRYLVELIEHLPLFLKHLPHLQVDLFHNNEIKPIHQFGEELAEREIKQFRQQRSMEEVVETQYLEYESLLLRFKAKVKSFLPDIIYRSIRSIYLAMKVRTLLYSTKVFFGKMKYQRETKKKAQLFASYDFVHVPLPQDVQYVEALQLPILATIHDLTHVTHPEYHDDINVMNAARGTKVLRERKANIIAVSQSTLNDTVEHYPEFRGKTYLTLEGVTHHKFYPSADADLPSGIRDKYRLPKGRYLMCLSTIEPRKNLEKTIGAFLNLVNAGKFENTFLLVCGKVGWKMDDFVRKYKDELRHVCFAGFVDDEDLPHLLAHALALCYISHYEGFGLPILEAMACGTPVIGGNNSSIPEVLGGGGLLVDSKNIQAIEDAMARLILDDELNDTLSKEAILQARKFSWLKMAHETINIYNIVTNNDMT